MAVYLSQTAYCISGRAAGKNIAISKAPEAISAIVTEASTALAPGTAVDAHGATTTASCRAQERIAVSGYQGAIGAASRGTGTAAVAAARRVSVIAVVTVEPILAGLTVASVAGTDIIPQDSGATESGEAQTIATG